MSIQDCFYATFAKGVHRVGKRRPVSNSPSFDKLLQASAKTRVGGSVFYSVLKSIFERVVDDVLNLAILTNFHVMSMVSFLPELHRFGWGGICL